MIPVTELFVRMLSVNFNSIHTVVWAVGLHNCVTFSDTFKLEIFLKTVIIRVSALANDLGISTFLSGPYRCA